MSTFEVGNPWAVQKDIDTNDVWNDDISDPETEHVNTTPTADIEQNAESEIDEPLSGQEKEKEKEQEQEQEQEQGEISSQVKQTKESDLGDENVTNSPLPEILEGPSTPTVSATVNPWGDTASPLTPANRTNLFIDPNTESSSPFADEGGFSESILKPKSDTIITKEENEISEKHIQSNIEEPEEIAKQNDGENDIDELQKSHETEAILERESKGGEEDKIEDQEEGEEADDDDFGSFDSVELEKFDIPKFSINDSVVTFLSELIPENINPPKEQQDRSILLDKGKSRKYYYNITARTRQMTSPDGSIGITNFRSKNFLQTSATHSMIADITKEWTKTERGIISDSKESTDSNQKAANLFHWGSSSKLAASIIPKTKEEKIKTSSKLVNQKLLKTAAASARKILDERAEIEREKQQRLLKEKQLREEKLELQKKLREEEAKKYVAPKAEKAVKKSLFGKLFGKKSKIASDNLSHDKVKTNKEDANGVTGETSNGEDDDFSFDINNFKDKNTTVQEDEDMFDPDIDDNGYNMISFNESQTNPPNGIMSFDEILFDSTVPDSEHKQLNNEEEIKIETQKQKQHQEVPHQGISLMTAGSKPDLSINNLDNEPVNDFDDGFASDEFGDEFSDFVSSSVPPATNIGSKVEPKPHNATYNSTLSPPIQKRIIPTDRLSNMKRKTILFEKGDPDDDDDGDDDDDDEFDDFDDFVTASSLKPAKNQQPTLLPKQGTDNIDFFDQFAHASLGNNTKSQSQAQSKSNNSDTANSTSLIDL